MIRDNELIYGTEDIEEVMEIHSDNCSRFSGHNTYKVNKKYKTYRNIPVDFLEHLYGEGWQSTFEAIYSDVKEFREEYRVELDEWMEYENEVVEE